MEMTIFTLLYVMVTPLENTQPSLNSPPHPPPLLLCRPSYPKQKLELYLGLDVGAVYGAGADLYNGHTIAGAALGVRGMIDALSYDVFAAMPVRKPDGFHTAKVTGGFSVGWKF